MSKIDIYNQKGEKSGSATLNKNVFAVDIDENLVHQALTRQLANKRVAVAHTKGRSDVSGGGKKPFRQKGTGNARQGTIRAPHFIGGGVVFGPKSTRNFKKNMPKKQRRKALFMALTAKANEKMILGLEELKMENPKTKELNELFKKLPLNKKSLVVIPEKNANLELSTRNMPNVKTILVNYLNIHDLLKHDDLIFVGSSLEKLEQVFVN